MGGYTWFAYLFSSVFVDVSFPGSAKSVTIFGPAGMWPGSDAGRGGVFIWGPHYIADLKLEGSCGEGRRGVGAAIWLYF